MAPRQRSQGRATAPAKQSQGGRYTPPIPRQQRHSPRWFPFVIVGLLVLGILVIIGNYAGLAPGGTSNWYLLFGIACIVVGLVMATFYH